MRKLAATALLGLSLLGAPVVAEVIADDAKEFLKPNTLAAQGCMKLGDCTDGVEPINDFVQLLDHYGIFWKGALAREILELSYIIEELNDVGVQMYLSDSFYFPKTVRGIYYTDDNHLYMNEFHGRNFKVFLEVLRHEAWHAAQDCMAGTIDNSLIAIILDPAEIPDQVKMLTEIRYKFYAPKAIPWEQEAIYAGGTPDMTLDALKACSVGQMWRVYTPTPKTEEWLKKEGFMK